MEVVDSVSLTSTKIWRALQLLWRMCLAFLLQGKNEHFRLDKWPKFSFENLVSLLCVKTEENSAVTPTTHQLVARNCFIPRHPSSVKYLAVQCTWYLQFWWVWFALLATAFRFFFLFYFLNKQNESYYVASTASTTTRSIYLATSIQHLLTAVDRHRYYRLDDLRTHSQMIVEQMNERELCAKYQRIQKIGSSERGVMRKIWKITCQCESRRDTVKI